MVKDLEADESAQSLLYFFTSFDLTYFACPFSSNLILLHFPYYNLPNFWLRDRLSITVKHSVKKF